MTFALAVPFCINAQPATKLGAARDVNPERVVDTRVQLDRRTQPVISINTRAAALQRQTKLQQPGLPARPAGSEARLGIASSPMFVAASATLYGSVVYSDDSYNFNPGIYEIPTDGSTQITEVAIDNYGNLSSTGGGFGFEGQYYNTSLETFWGFIFIYHTIWDAETWEMIEEVENEDLTSVARAVAYDELTGTAYGCFYNEDGSGYIFGSQDPDTFVTTPIADLEESWFGCAIAADGTIYAINASGFLCRVDRATGALTTIGDTGITPAYQSAAIIDQKTGVMYWTVSPTDFNGYIATVDLTTGAATILAQLQYNEEVVGLYMPTAAADNAPAAVELLNVVFNEGQLDGYLTFDMPSTQFDGAEPANLPWTYHVVVNGTEVASKEAAPGQAVSVNLDIAQNGNVQIIVYVTDATGAKGPKTKQSLYVGYDIPEATEGVELTYAAGKFNLTWDAVSEGTSGGYIGNITYNTTLYVDGVATSTKTGLTATSLQEAVTAPTDHVAAYYYTVTALNDGIEGEAMASNVVVLGNLVPAFEETFETEASVYPYTIIDNNEDERTWYWYDGVMRCRYDSYNDMDDWLISPAIKLEGGKLYEFTAALRSYSEYFQERFEIYYGTDNTVEAMTNQLVAPTEPGTEFEVYDAILKIDADGLYYIGFHGISDADMFYLELQSWGLSEAIDQRVPGKVTNVGYVQADELLGENSIQMEFTTPVLSAGGDYLVAVEDMPAEAAVVEQGSLTKIEIYRGNDLINVFSDPVEGDQLIFTDVVSEPDYYVYTIVAYNKYGAGLPYQINAFVGINYPGTPENVTIVENPAKLGEVTVSFDKVTTDIDGHSMNPDDIMYVVADYNGEIMAQGYETSFTFQAVPAGEQDFVYYWVYGRTERGDGKPSFTGIIAAGTPFEMPVFESFTDEGLTYPLMITETSSEDVVVDIFADDYFSDITSSDNDNGYLVMKGTAVGDYAVIETGKIAITGETPILSFDYYGISEDDENEVIVAVLCEGEMHGLGSVPQTGDGEWVTVCTDMLREYIGKSVQLVFIPVVYSHAYILLDNIKVYEPLTCDLAATEISAPAKAVSNTDFTVSVTVANEGLTMTDAYTVELYRNGELVDAQDGTEIDFLEEAVFEFTQNLPVLGDEENLYKAVVVCAADENEENNVTEEYPVILTIPNYPTVENLKFEGTSPAVGVLSWNEPDLSAAGIKETVTEDFESYEAWGFSAGDWTLVDADGEAVGNSSGGVPGITTGVTTMAYIVFNTALVDYSVYAHSGDQCMSTMFNQLGSQQADWLISPALSGDAQTISLYAMSFTDSYGLESFKVLYSTTDREITSFTEVAEYSAPAEWTQFTFDVPEGAKYFAIECVSQDIYMMWIDDITYTPANAITEELTILGYNVYKNGELVDYTEETYFVDFSASKDDVYSVTVVYAQGESAAESVTVFDPTTGVEDIAAKATTIRVNNRAIEVAGAEGIVNVYTIDGRAICTEAAAARNTIIVAPGVYVVKAGTTVKTVVVR